MQLARNIFKKAGDSERGRCNREGGKEYLRDMEKNI